MLISEQEEQFIGGNNFRIPKVNTQVDPLKELKQQNYQNLIPLHLQEQELIQPQILPNNLIFSSSINKNEIDPNRSLDYIHDIRSHLKNNNAINKNMKLSKLNNNDYEVANTFDDLEVYHKTYQKYNTINVNDENTNENPLLDSNTKKQKLIRKEDKDYNFHHLNKENQNLQERFNNCINYDDNYNDLENQNTLNYLGNKQDTQKEYYNSQEYDDKNEEYQGKYANNENFNEYEEINNKDLIINRINQNNYSMKQNNKYIPVKELNNSYNLKFKDNYDHEISTISHKANTISTINSGRQSVVGTNPGQDAFKHQSQYQFGNKACQSSKKDFIIDFKSESPKRYNYYSAKQNEQLNNSFNFHKSNNINNLQSNKETTFDFTSDDHYNNKNPEYVISSNSQQLQDIQFTNKVQEKNHSKKILNQNLRNNEYNNPNNPVDQAEYYYNNFNYSTNSYSINVNAFENLNTKSAYSFKNLNLPNYSFNYNKISNNRKENQCITTEANTDLEKTRKELSNDDHPFSNNHYLNIYHNNHYENNNLKSRLESQSQTQNRHENNINQSAFAQMESEISQEKKKVLTSKYNSRVADLNDFNDYINRLNESMSTHQEKKDSSRFFEGYNQQNETGKREKEQSNYKNENVSVNDRMKLDEISKNFLMNKIIQHQKAEQKLYKK